MTIIDEKKPGTSTTAATRPTPRSRWPRRIAASAGRGLLAVVRSPRHLGAAARTPRRLLITLVVVAVVLAAVLVALVWSVHRDNASATAGDEAQRVASQKVVALLSYDYHTVRQDLPPVLDSLTGPFKDEYGRLLNQAVIPAAEQQQVTTRTSLAGSSVMSASPDHVELLMFLNQTSVTPGQPQPQLAGSRAKVTLDLVDGQWKVSGLTPV